MSIRSACWATAIALLAAALPSAAHDSWVVLDRGSAAPGDAVRAAFITSEHFPRSAHATQPDRVAEWIVLGPGGRQAITDFAIDGTELAASFRAQQSGTLVVAVALKPRPIEMARDRFVDYLRSERADEALRQLETRGVGPQKEHYTKFAKAYLRVGDSGSECPPVGHRLEIVPLSDPATWQPNRPVRVRVMLEGRPLADALVSSGRDGLPQHGYAQTASTDRHGDVEFTFDRPGLWFLRTHRIAASSRADADHGWESWWASMTFRVGDGSDLEQVLTEVAAIHGMAGPWAVAGYRMGRRALQEMGMKRGSFDLIVTHECPPQVQYSCIADGVQAATGASAGKLNLIVREAPAEQMRTTFARKSTGETVIMELTPAFRRRFLNVPYDKLEAAGREVAAMPDGELFRVAISDGGAPGGPTTGGR